MSSHKTSRVIASPTSPTVSPQRVSSHNQSLYAHDSLGIPLGKYYPSNYKYLVSTTGTPAPDQSRPISSMNLDTGLWYKKRATKKMNWHKSHDQKASDVTMKMQKYQRDMITQARNAVKERNLSIRNTPERVTLHPTENDYGKITPFELAGTETSGYIAEGERRKFERQQNMTGVGSKNVDDIKERLIKIIST